jgi:acyl-CoA synthetase (NDP forming)
MEKIFYPESMVIIGLSSRAENLPRMILENLLRWGYRGKIFGLNPRSEDVYVDGIKMYKNIDDLPQVPDLAVCLIPARFIPDHVEMCGKFGIKRMAIPSGGFSEFSEEGKRLSDLTLKNARKYGLRFVGPNGFTVANRANGLCLLFVPFYPPPLGEISVISQSGGLGTALWNPFIDEHLGMAKFASVGNKLDLDEVDFLEYFGKDPDTKIIFMYLENINRGKKLVEAASAIDKPIIVLKSNTTPTGSKAAMSHTAALSNDEDVVDAAFEKAGIIRIHNFPDFIAMAKAFKLPRMQGNRIMVMSPAGGIAVSTADLCNQAGFEFADPGEDFYQSLQTYSKAGVIRFSNPLDMGDIYDPKFTAHIFSSVMHNEHSDCALYVSHWPHMPAGDDVFSRMLHADLSKETWGAILSSGKPVGVCLLGISQTITKIKKNVNFPVFNNPEEMVRAMAAQRDFYARKATGSVSEEQPSHINRGAAQKWITAHQGIGGEETLDLLSLYGIPIIESLAARDESEAQKLAEKIGYPVAMKVVSPDAIHKSEAQGVMVDIKNPDEVKKAFLMIKKNLSTYKPGADFRGVRMQKMVSDGYDMFIGGKYDAAFGPVVYFGFGGIYVEVFHDIDLALCPSTQAEIEAKVKKLKSYTMLKGFRGNQTGDTQGYIESIVRISHLLADFSQIKELDINPLRILSDGTGIVALDARIKIEER